MTEILYATDNSILRAEATQPPMYRRIIPYNNYKVSRYTIMLLLFYFLIYYLT